MKAICCTVTLVLSAVIVAATAAEPSSWTALVVPGVWEEVSDGQFKEHDGYAWYRCLVTLPGSWKGKDLVLHFGPVDDAYEVYVNGTKVGGAGTFPPKPKSGGDAKAKYTVEAKHVVSGNNLIAVRVYDHGGQGGFSSEAPIVSSGDKAIGLNGRWEFRTGDDPAWAKGPTKLTSTGIFWRVHNLADVQARFASQSGGALSPEAAAETFTVPDDLEWQQVLSEPEVRQPLFMNFDERGRLWVMNYLQYPYPNGLKMVSKDKYWRAVYDKIPKPPPHGPKGADRITIHKDTDGDGRFDKHKTFLEGLNISSSFARGRGGVWVINPPYLLFYPDRDNNDQPDGPPEVHLKGFGMEDTHSIANSLRWGPDGWLYAAQGSTVSGNIMRPGDKKAVHSMGQLIWRYHPGRRKYEIFAEGGGNAFGVEIDDKGRIFSGHNGGNTRGFHYVQGGYYRKGFGKHGPLSNPYTFGYFNAMGHHNVPRFTHNFVIYGGGTLPEPYHGRLFGIEPLQGKVVMSEVERDRSSFKTTDLSRPVSTTDKQFRPVDVKVGPDGAIYVADFYEPQISHREHFSGQIDKTTGRVYRLQARDAKPLEPFDLSQRTTAELIGLLGHQNRWFRQTALRLIGDRRDPSAVPLLKQKVAEEDGQLALECLWALYQTGGFDDQFALKSLGHDDPFVRMWTVRLVCDDRQVPRKVADRLAELAATELYVQVRSQLASSAKRLPAAQGLPIVRQLMARSEDVNDVHLPLLIWWAIESKAASAPDAVVELFEDGQVWQLPLVREHLIGRLVRRFAQSGSRNDLLVCAKLFHLAPDDQAAQQLMDGFEQAFKGRTLAGIPAELADALAKAGGGSLSLRVRQQDAAAIDEALKRIADAGTKKETRVELIQVFGEIEEPRCVPVLLGALSATGDADVRKAMLTALGAYDRERIGEVVVGLYGSLDEPVRRVAQSLLASRKVWARQFLEAIDAGRIDAATIPLDVVRKMTVHRDERIAELVAKHWKDIQGASTAEMQAQIESLSGVLSAGAGNPYDGKKLYTKTCGKCHILFGEGGRIGPELTTYKRDDTLRILINVVNPSAEVREGFETYLVLTEDGRTATGFLFDQDNRVIVLRGADGQNITIARDRIEELIPQKKSVMPQGLLKDLSEQQVRDLFSYLRSSQPLNN